MWAPNKFISIAMGFLVFANVVVGVAIVAGVHVSPAFGFYVLTLALQTGLRLWADVAQRKGRSEGV